MKLRFRNNSLRLRLNQQEVDRLAAGNAVQENVYFPGNSSISYILDPTRKSEPAVSFRDGVLRIAATTEQVQQWAGTDAIGIYFELPVAETSLKVAVEKDLECLHPRAHEEPDPDAFPRSTGKNN